MPEDLKGRVRKARKQKPLYERPGMQPGQNAHGPFPKPPRLGAPPAAAVLDPLHAQGFGGFDKAKGKRPDFGELRQAHQGERGDLQGLKARLERLSTEKQPKGSTVPGTAEGAPDLSGLKEKLAKLRGGLQEFRFARQDFPGAFGEKPKKKSRSSRMTGPAGY